MLPDHDRMIETCSSVLSVVKCIWSGRKEVIETSGRLHPLWPQDKRLHTPRTADYRHTRQDRWIQTELISTLAKNATKPNLRVTYYFSSCRKVLRSQTSASKTTGVNQQIAVLQPITLYHLPDWKCLVSSLVLLHLPVSLHRQATLVHKVAQKRRHSETSGKQKQRERKMKKQL